MGLDTHDCFLPYFTKDKSSQFLIACLVNYVRFENRSTLKGTPKGSKNLTF